MTELKRPKIRKYESLLKNRYRKPYRKPQLTEYGTLEIITQGTGSMGKEGTGFTMN
jgi:hypothetical protein